MTILKKCWLTGILLLGLLISGCGQTPTTVPVTPVPLVTATAIPPATITPVAQPISPVSPVAAPGEVPVYTYRVLNTYPHDPGAFTQGLVFTDGVFFEGTGLYGQSTLRRVEVETGKAKEIKHLLPSIFGEGITLFGDKIIQISWKEQRGFVYNRNTFELLQEFTYPTEGWGITHDDTHLIMSDGSDTLYFWNPETFAETGKVKVFDSAGPVSRLNELEYINGEVYANIWQTDKIARINPQTGAVTGWIDLTGLLSPEDRAGRQIDVLNGIAFDAPTGRLFVTGKWWPKLFEIELLPTN